MVTILPSSRRARRWSGVGLVAVLVLGALAWFTVGAVRSKNAADAATPSLSALGKKLDKQTIKGAFLARVVGSSCRSVTFVLDGRFLVADHKKPFATAIRVAPGKHRVKARCYDKSGQHVTLSATYIQATTGARTQPSPTGGATGSPPSSSTAPTLAVPATGPIVTVSTSTELTAALAAAESGQTIKLADGVYRGNTQSGDFNASFVVDVGGITITGGRGAVVDGDGPDGRYGLYLSHVSGVTLRGFSVANASKGVVIDASTKVTMDDLAVHDIGAEGVHFRDNTTDSVLQHSQVFATGLSKPQFGEGVYVGSAVSNWGKYSGGQPDASNNNRILDNTITNTGAENIDIKEGTAGGTVQGNRLGAEGIAGKNSADSWIDVKGNNWLIVSNTGTNPTDNPHLLDGFQTHVLTDGAGESNVFRANVLDLGNAAGFGINVTSPGSTHNVVRCDNRVSGAALGLSNVTCV